MKRYISTILITLLLNSAFAAGALAQTNTVGHEASVRRGGPERIDVVHGEMYSAAKQQTQLQAAKKGDGSFDVNKAESQTMGSYQKNKAAGKKFSTQTKILIGVGIAAAIAGIVIYAASRDKIRTF